MPRRPRTEKISQEMKSKGRSARGENTAMPEKAQQSYRPTVTACCTGYICEAVANNFLPLLFLIFQSSLGISLKQLTLLVTVNFMTQLAVDLISARLIDRIGYRRCVIFAHLLTAVGLLSLAALPSLLPVPYAGLLCAVVLYAAGSGLIEVLVSPIIEACPAPDKHSLMSLMHSFYCFGTVAVVIISTLSLRIFGSDSWQFIAAAWALLPIGNAILFSRVPIYSMTELHGSMPVKRLLRTPIFWALFFLMFAAGACEMAMSQWASAFTESGLGVSKTVGDLLGVCMFSLMMGISRFLRSRVNIKASIFGLMAGCGVLCTASYLLAALAPHPALALLGCGLCGFSVGILWPGVYSMAGELCPTGGTAMFAFLALAGDVGSSGGPALVGCVAGSNGNDLSLGMLFSAVFPIMLIVFALLTARRSRRS